MKVKTKKNKVLRRYTSLPALLHLLKNEKITLLSPATWDDRNDRFFMNEYKRRMKVKSVLALCFTTTNETYHHWKVFTNGSDGVRIDFKQEEFLAAIKKHKVIQARPVTYKKIAAISHLRPKVSDLPFLKREPYGDERELRLVCVDRDEEIESKEFEIDLACIQRITLNPWLPESLVESVRSTIRLIGGECETMEIYQTTLLENKKWKRAAMRSA